MLISPPALFRLAYCLVVLGTVLPLGIAASGWVALVRGASLLGALPLVGLLAAFAIGGFRIYLVARFPTTLSSPPVTGLARLARVLGLVAVYVGALTTVLSWVARPLMRAFMTSRTESGAEFFVVGLYLSLAAGIGLLGIFMFEFSRLLAFEKLAYRHQAAQTGP